MCMHDEATPHYIDLIDQTTLGHIFIKDEFGRKPRVGWQIDPFGHSAVQAYLLGAELGFDSLFFARIDYQDRAKRKDEKTLEVVWQGSKSLGSSSQIFTGIFPRHYDPPDGFTFEINDVSPPIQDDVLLFDYNVQERVNDFVTAAIAQANVTRTNHIMWAMGTDFRYQYANSWFRQMDKFIHYVNLDGRVNALYSTPSVYTDAKFATNELWPIKTGDFFPYADRENAYWTGYFTSRPAFKGYVRMMSGYYLAARQLELFKGRSSSGPNTDALADALAIAQHHDAVSGTERQHVAADYAKRLSMGYAEAGEVVASSLALLAESKLSPRNENSVTKFQQCPLLNISYCPPSEAVLSNEKSLVVVVYNPLGWKREEVIRIPVSTGGLIVHDSGGIEIESQLLPLSNASLSSRNYHVKAYLGRSPTGTLKYWLAFSASVPPLGFSTYIVSSAKQTGASSTISTVYTSKESTDNIVEVGQGNLKLLYSADEGKLTRYVNSRNLVTAFSEQSYSYYSGYNGTDKDPQASGAYVFRPNGTFPINSGGQVPLTIMRGLVMDEVHQQLSPWLHQITRVYKGKEHAEVEFNIGPIPVDDGFGKEIITQITTAMKTNKAFYTDSNGRDFIKRIRDYRDDWDLQVNQPIAGNYYPINLGIYVEDESMELSVLVDRAVGGSSLVDGQIELMLHRRLLHDDSRGVGEALNEEVCVLDECRGLMVQGKFYIRIDPLGEGARWRRTFGQEIYSPLLLAFTEQEGNNWMNTHVATFSGIDPSYSLPNNIAVITLQELESGKVLLRLAHLYEIGEDKDYSVMTSVELKRLFPNKKIHKLTEMNLSGNQERAEMEKKRLAWKVEGTSDSEPKISNSESSVAISNYISGPVAPTAEHSGRSSKKVNEPGKPDSKKSLAHQSNDTVPHCDTVGHGEVGSTRHNGKLSGTVVSPQNQQTPGSINFQGSAAHSSGRKTQMVNGNHLLNFRYDPISRPQPRAPPPRRKQKRKPYNKDLFLQANYKFVVLDSGNYTRESLDPDKMLQWEDIVCVKYSTPFPIQCPICLEDPLCPQITSCGHIFCFPCILRYFLNGEHDNKDECWKKCPLCFMMMSSKDLYTIYIENVKQHCVGDTIEFMLLTRQKDSFSLSRKNKQEMDTHEELQDSFSKFIFTSDVDLSVRKAISDLDSWLARADSGLVDDLEKLPYVCASLEQLEQRKTYWNEHGVCNGNKACKPNDSDTRSHESLTPANDINADHEACDFIWGTLSPSVNDEPKWMGNSTPDKLDGEGCLDQTAVVVESLEDQDGTLSSSYDDSKSMQKHSIGFRDRKERDSYNFYQAVDGQHIILHPLNMKCLLHHYGSYDMLPHRIAGKILQLEQVTQSEAIRRRYRYLSHFSLTTTFQLCEIDLSDILPPIALSPFMDEIKSREKQRKHFSRKERGEKIKAEVAAAHFVPIPFNFAQSSRDDPPSFTMDDFEAVGNAGTTSFASIISRAKPVEGVDGSKVNEMGKKGKKPSRVLLSTAGGRRY
ncbi:hypothetical protein F0562_004764 [Nyssa sinensis]|uniref:RING-type domain-containing protein n=1 Tax=Nyssa sinensis TaxID=561372 RepID=A0A5J5AG77_9ASTE|nr:hypothetical protein F0562_004764 [Nyssa sinensis]